MNCDNKVTFRKNRLTQVQMVNFNSLQEAAQKAVLFSGNNRTDAAKYMNSFLN